MKKCTALLLTLMMIVTIIPLASFAEEKIVITWMDDRTGDDGWMLRHEFVIKPFLEKHPNVEIDWQPTIDITKQVKIALAAGAGPDLMSVDGPTDAIELYESGRTIALNDAIAKYGWDKVIYDWILLRHRMVLLPACLLSMRVCCSMVTKLLWMSTDGRCLLPMKNLKNWL